MVLAYTGGTSSTYEYWMQPSGGGRLGSQLARMIQNAAVLRHNQGGWWLARMIQNA
jgi:hypothetical protein